MRLTITDDCTFEDGKYTGHTAKILRVKPCDCGDGECKGRMYDVALDATGEVLTDLYSYEVEVQS